MKVDKLALSISSWVIFLAYAVLTFLLDPMSNRFIRIVVIALTIVAFIMITGKKYKAIITGLVFYFLASIVLIFYEMVSWRILLTFFMILSNVFFGFHIFKIKHYKQVEKIYLFAFLIIAILNGIGLYKILSDFNSSGAGISEVARVYTHGISYIIICLIVCIYNFSENKISSLYMLFFIFSNTLSEFGALVGYQYENKYILYSGRLFFIVGLISLLFYVVIAREESDQRKKMEFLKTYTSK